MAGHLGRRQSAEARASRRVRDGLAGLRYELRPMSLRTQSLAKDPHPGQRRFWIAILD